MKMVRANVLDIVLLCVLYFLVGVLGGLAIGSVVDSNKRDVHISTCSHEYDYEWMEDNLLRITQVPALNECKED